MKIRLNELLGLQNKEVSIKECVEKFYVLSDKYVSLLVDQLSSYNLKQRLYVYPDNDLSLALSIKKLIIAGFLIVYEFSRSPIVLVQLDLLLKNDKLCTPDVAFFVISLINNILAKKDVHNFDEQINKINQTMGNIANLDQKYFDVNLFNVKTLELNEETIKKDIDINPDEVVKNIVESFLKSLSGSSDSSISMQEITDQISENLNNISPQDIPVENIDDSSESVEQEKTEI